jgi:hypothetical protein
MVQEHYVVVVEAEFDSEWYLTPLGFSDFRAAMQHAIGIARSWQDRADAPRICIRGDGNAGELWTVKRLLASAPLIEDRCPEVPKASAAPPT